MKIKKFLKKSFWKNFLKIINSKDRIVFLSSLSVAIICLIIILSGWYFNNTKLLPRNGGVLKIAQIGQPTAINPILAANETDQELLGILFNGLVKIDDQGKIVNDLAEDIEISDDFLTWKIKLKEDVKWHDGEDFNADDVLFTISSIQNSNSRSPWRSLWQGVRVEKEGDFTIIFQLGEEQSFFEENLKQKIAPEHIFQDVPLSNLYLSDYNFQPIGTGPYIFNRFEKSKSGFINSYYLEKNNDYYLDEPFISNLVIKFYKTEPEAVKAFNNREADFVAGISSSSIDDINRKFNEVGLILPRYFAVFLNEGIHRIFSEKDVRRAMSLSIDRGELIENVFSGRADIIFGPTPFNINDLDYSLSDAENILIGAGWEDQDDDGIKDKKINSGDILPVPLEFTMITPQSNELIEVASYLKKQWAKIGIRVDIKVVPVDELEREYFNSRVYEAMLFGNLANSQFDIFPFWHSSQRFYPGMNLAIYNNSEADDLLEDIRKEFNPIDRADLLEEVGDIISNDFPAVFLFNPWYNLVYFTGLNIGDESSGFILPNDKYSNIHKWSLRTKRVWK